MSHFEMGYGIDQGSWRGNEDELKRVRMDCLSVASHRRTCCAGTKVDGMAFYLPFSRQRFFYLLQERVNQREKSFGCRVDISEVFWKEISQGWVLSSAVDSVPYFGRRVLCCSAPPRFALKNSIGPASQLSSEVAYVSHIFISYYLVCLHLTGALV